MKRVMRKDMTPIERRSIEQGISRAELSRRSGVPIRTLESWADRSRVNPSVYQLYKVAQVLECHMEDLIDPAIIEANEKKNPEG